MSIITLTASTKGIGPFFVHDITYTHEDDENILRVGSNTDETQFDATDDVLRTIMRQEAGKHRQSGVIIRGTTLPESSQTFLVDKYESGTAFTSVTFA